MRVSPAAEWENRFTIAIIVVNFRTSGDTVECLESVLKLRSDHALQVIVIDNASGDGSLELLSNWAASQSGSSKADCSHIADAEAAMRARFWLRAPSCATSPIQLTIAATPRNLGFAGGVNAGLKIAAADPRISYFWLLNSDTVVDPGSLLPLVEASRQAANLAIVGSTLIYYDCPRVVQAAAGAKYLPLLGRSRHVGKMRAVDEVVLWDTSLDLDYVVGASMFFSRAVVDRAGPLPEHYFLYFEETDWCFTARRKGIVLIWAKESRVFHKEGRSVGTSAFFAKLSDVAFYYLCRNSMLYTWEKYPHFLLTVVGFNFAQCLKYAVLGEPFKLKVFGMALFDFWEMRRSNAAASIQVKVGV